MQKSDPKPETCEPVPRRARGRPRAFDRNVALAEATRLFWLKGFEATSMADLTEAMGIGAPSLYAAFGSKEALFAEALRYYADSNGSLVWGRFFDAGNARDAVSALLMDSAGALTGCAADVPRGCMVALSSVGSEGHSELGNQLLEARAVTFERLKTRLEQAASKGEIPASTDIDALARFVQTVQFGMSILARDGASRADLEGVATISMLGWDARTARDNN